MFEDKWLLWKLKQGDSSALCRIYEKYKNDLLGLAIALSNNKTVAEDIVHDVFVSFARSANKLQLKTSLKSYLSTAVANRVRNSGRDKFRQSADVSEFEIAGRTCDCPDRLAISKEQMQRISFALDQLPDDQKEVIILHLQSGLKFNQIAKSQNISINTIQSRYRYGIEKLRSILNVGAQK